MSLTVVFTVSYALGASQTSPRDSHTAVEIAEVWLGILLIGVAVREWRRKDTQAEKKAVGGLAVLQDRVLAAGPAVFAIAALVVGVFLMVDGVTGLQGN